MSKKRKPLPDTIFSGDVVSLSDEGRGIVHQADKTVFIDGVLAGETVTYKLTKQRRRILEARVESVTTPSKERVQPECEHANLCGGCSLQHMGLEAQIQMKQASLLKQLKHFGGIAPEEILAPVTAKAYGYRRKARLGVRFVDKKDKLLIGFREKSSRYLADIHSCAVLHPEVNQLLPDLSQLIAGLSVMRAIPQVEVAVGDNQVALVFRHLAPFTAADLRLLATFSYKHQIHIYGQSGNEETVQGLYPPQQVGAASLTYALKKHDIRFNFRPTDFVQVNAKINEQLLDNVIDYLEINKNDTVLDLFCGLGNLTLPMARYAKEVTGVEWSTALTDRALTNAHENQLDNVNFYAADLTKQLPDAEWMQKEYTKLVLDPPRSGAEAIIKQLAGKRFEKIVYVSCKPATLARDAGLLAEQGYRLVKAGVLDMFPHTAHVESIAVFERN